MKLPFLDRLFLKVSDDIITKNNTMQMSVIISPRFGKLGLFIWYVLRKISNYGLNTKRRKSLSGIFKMRR